MHLPNRISNLDASAKSTKSARPTQRGDSFSARTDSAKIDPLPLDIPQQTAWGDADPELVMSRLWQRMASMYSMWADRYGADAKSATGEEWGASLCDLTLDQLRDGLKACAKGRRPRNEWVPNLGEFRELCLQLPPIPEVRRQLLSKDGQRSPFATLVASRLDTYRWRQVDQRDADAMLREAYAEARAHALAGGELPQQVPAIAQEREPEPASPKPTAEQAAAARAEALRMIREELGGEDVAGVAA